PFPVHPAKDFALSGRKEPDVVRTTDLTIPEPGAVNGQVRIKGVNVATPVSYNGDIYLSPPDVEFNPQDREFREKYFADLISIWKAHSGHDHSGHGGHGAHDASADSNGRIEVDLVVDLTPQLSSLAQSHAGETWKLNIALTAFPEQVRGNGLRADAAPSAVSRSRDEVAALIDIKDVQMEP
ncbi:MAG TPA: hypothetical protein VGE04_15970, partial [Chloroflexia bacterium]